MGQKPRAVKYSIPGMALAATGLRPLLHEGNDMDSKPAKPLRMFINPLASWADLAIKTGQAMIASAHAAAAQANARKVAVIPTADAPKAAPAKRQGKPKSKPQSKSKPKSKSKTKSKRAPGAGRR